MSAKKSTNPHRGGLFDDFLAEQGELEAATEAAIKRVLAWELGELMASQGLSKAELTRRMGTSRSSLERLLDPENDVVTLATLRKAARAVGRRVKLRLVAA